MTVHRRGLQGEADFWAIHRFLVAVHRQVPPGLNWDIRQWEGKYLYGEQPGWEAAWLARSAMWETDDGQIVGVLHPDGGPYAAIQIDPAYRHLEGVMLDWAAEHMLVEGRLVFFVWDYDAYRQKLLTERGFEPTERTMHHRVMRLPHTPLPDVPLAAGYRLHTTQAGSREDSQRVADIVNAAFKRTFHTMGEHFTFAQHAPSFHHDLDLAAVTPDGRFASYVGVLYDEVNGHGIFEPVCTHPEHQRKGLARALMVEGLRRLQARGAFDVMVESTAEAAHRLYAGVVDGECYIGRYWRKQT